MKKSPLEMPTEVLLLSREARQHGDVEALGGNQRRKGRQCSTLRNQPADLAFEAAGSPAPVYRPSLGPCGVWDR